MEMIVSKGNKVLLDDMDYETIKAHKWYYDGRYCYRRETLSYNQEKRSYKTRKIYLHRQLLNFPAKGLDIDHINCNKLDNRRSNLRIVTRSQNAVNKPKFGEHTSQYKGVCWHKQRGKWKAEARQGAVKRYLGVFDCEHAAALAYNIHMQANYGEYAMLNVITKGD